MTVEVVEYYLLDTPATGLAWLPVGGGPVLPVIDTSPIDPDPGEETPGGAEALLLVSSSPTREQAQQADGRTVSGSLAVFVSEQGVASVRFSIDGVFERQENSAPFDLKGGLGADAVMWSPPPGVHTVTAEVTYSDASREPVTLTAVIEVETETIPTDPTLTAPDVTATPGPGAIALSWPAVAGATRYRVYRNGSVVAEPIGTGYTDSTPSAGVAYTYTVAAVNSVGEGPLSDPDVATAEALPTGSQIPGTFQPSPTNVGHGTGGYTSVLEPMSGGTFPGGTVIQNKDISGSVVFSGPGGKLINCRIRYSGAGSAVTTNSDSHSGTVIERCTIEAPAGVGVSTRNGSIVRFTRITAGKDGVKAWNDSLYESLYVKMSRPAGSSVHLDALQGSGKTRWVVRGCHLEVNHPEGGNFAWFCQAFMGDKTSSNNGERVCEDVLCERNWLYGGNKAIATEDGKTGSGWLRNVVVRDNKVAHQGRYYPNVAQYNNGGDVRRSNNVWMTDGPAGAAGTPI